MVTSAPYTVVGDRLAQIIFNSLFSIGIIVYNIILIVCILSKRELRHNSKYILVLLLALADFYTGIFVLPMWTHTLVTQTLDYSCSTSNVMYGSSYVHLAISCVAIVSVNLEYIFQNTMKSYHGKIRKVMTVALALLFLIGPLLVLVPIFVYGTVSTTDANCGLSLKVTYARVARILSYWAPVVCIVFTTIVVIVIHQKHRRRLQYPGEPHQPCPSGLSQSSPADLILAALLTVALNFPTQVFIEIQISCAGNCDWYYTLNTVFVFFSDAKALVLPFVWFANRCFRDTMIGRSSPARTDIVLGQVPMNCNQSYMVTASEAQIPNPHTEIKQ